MNRPIRIGLIAEGEAELGASIPYIKPEDGGKVIEKNTEGALHTLIRRELKNAGITDCDFVQRHPLSTESRYLKRRTGHSILDQKYLAQVVISWKPEEVDMILIVVDADNTLPQRQRELKRALEQIRSNHLDINDQPIGDCSAGGLAIKNLETWLLADTQAVSRILSIELERPENIEDLNNTKDILEKIIAESTYLSEESSNLRPLQIRWVLAFEVDLETIKNFCVNGYATFAQNLVTTANKVIDKITNL